MNHSSRSTRPRPVRNREGEDREPPPSRILGAAVGGLIVLTNGRTLVNTIGLEGNPQIAAHVVLIAIRCLAITVVVRGVRLELLQTVATGV
jgi:uncharacterized protein